MQRKLNQYATLKWLFLQQYWRTPSRTQCNINNKVWSSVGMQATWNLLTAEDKVWLLTGKRRCGGTEPSMRRFQQFGLQQHKTIKFYVLLTVHPCIIFFKRSQLAAHYFLVYLFQLLYMFRATMCPSSGELTVSMPQWYFSLCVGWFSSQPAVQTATYTEWNIPVSHRYSKFSWW